jgi:hypothetical protein
MPNLRSQSITRDGIAITGSDGRSYAITFAEAKAIFEGKTGTRAQKLLATAVDIKAAAVAAVGAEQLPAVVGLSLDPDNADADQRGWKDLLVGALQRGGGSG